MADFQRVVSTRPRSFTGALCLADGFVGAGAFAGAAVDALVCVDYVGSVTGADCANGANLCAGATGYTKIGINFSCHDNMIYM